MNNKVDRKITPPHVAVGEANTSVLHTSLQREARRRPNFDSFDVFTEVTQEEWGSMRALGKKYAQSEFSLDWFTRCSSNGKILSIIDAFPIIALVRLAGDQAYISPDASKILLEEAKDVLDVPYENSTNKRMEYLQYAAMLAQIIPDTFPKFDEYAYKGINFDYKPESILETIFYAKILFPHKSVEEITQMYQRGIQNPVEDLWQKTVEHNKRARKYVRDEDRYHAEAMLRLLFPDRWEKELKPTQSKWRRLRKTLQNTRKDPENIQRTAKVALDLTILAADKAYIDENGVIVIIPYGQDQEKGVDSLPILMDL